MDKSSNSLLLHSLTGSLLMNLEIVVLGFFFFNYMSRAYDAHQIHFSYADGLTREDSDMAPQDQLCVKNST